MDKYTALQSNVVSSDHIAADQTDILGRKPRMLREPVVIDDEESTDEETYWNEDGDYDDDEMDYEFDVGWRCQQTVLVQHRSSLGNDSCSLLGSLMA